MQPATGSDALFSNGSVIAARAKTTRWYCDPTDVLFGMRLYDSGALYRLTVEQVATAWNWTIWRVGRLDCVQSGVAASSARAMRDAQRAVAFLEAQVAAT